MRLFSWKGTFIWYFFPLLLFSAHRLYVDPWWSVSSHKQSWNHCQFVNHTKSQCWRWWHLFMSCWPNWTYQCENTCSYRYLFIFIMMLQKTGDGNHHIFSCLNINENTGPMSNYDTWLVCVFRENGIFPWMFYCIIDYCCFYTLLGDNLRGLHTNEANSTTNSSPNLMILLLFCIHLTTTRQ